MTYEVHPLEKLCPSCNLVKPLVAWPEHSHVCYCCHASEWKHWWRATKAKPLPAIGEGEIRFGNKFGRRSAAIGRECREHK
jgi:hypothetical protein